MTILAYSQIIPRQDEFEFAEMKICETVGKIAYGNKHKNLAGVKVATRSTRNSDRVVGWEPYPEFEALVNERMGGKPGRLYRSRCVWFCLYLFVKNIQFVCVSCPSVETDVL